jgi:hypothetical protein
MEKRKGDAKTKSAVIDFKIETKEECIARLTSQKSKMKTLKKLRCKPQGSEVFRSGSMEIDANGACPENLSSFVAKHS